MTIKATLGIYDIELIGDNLFVHQNSEAGFKLVYLPQPGDIDRKILEVEDGDSYYPLVVFHPKQGGSMK